MAAVPVRDGESGAILTVPLTLRQQEIEGEVAALDRRVVLAAVLFILLGAAIGYVTAERLGDPIQRLTRATGRIARGDLNARILTAPADELGRLVEAFNQMAEDLQRQRAELERTNRLAAWADMARQVAHDIKNPLTPIQLQAEFLKRVHADSGVAAWRGRRHLRRHDSVAGQPAAFDRQRVFEFRVVAGRALCADASSTRSSTKCWRRTRRACPTGSRCRWSRRLACRCCGWIGGCWGAPW